VPLQNAIAAAASSASVPTGPTPDIAEADIDAAFVVNV
jgi:hypothetical protein